MTHLTASTDIAVFGLVIIQTQMMKSVHRGMNRSKILDTVSRDAGIYFALITTSHLLTVVMNIAARVEFSLPVSEFDVC